MGIESDQVVYDYLSKVGDLAQATTLTAAERARLVSGLRDTIDSRRSGTSASAAAGSARGELPAVRKILAGIGSPDEVVRRAVHNGVPRDAERGREGTSGGVRRREEAYGGGTGPSVPVQGGPPPGERSQVSAGGTEGWWSVGGRLGDGTGGGSGGGFGGSGGFGPGGPGGGLGAADLGAGELPGWRASFEPDFLDPDYVDPAERVPLQRQPPAVPDAADEAVPQPVAGPPPRSLLRRLLGGPPPVVAEVVAQPVARPPLPLLESLAALVLVAAAVLDLWYVALLGWGIAYTGRRIGRQAAHIAGLWIPLLVACGCGYWLYTHTHGQPAGHQLTDAQFKAALRSATSFWLRSSAACSVAFLAWRISRRR